MFTIPTLCPDCQTVLQKTSTGIDLLCPNSSGCKAQIVGRLSYFAQRNMANIPGLSEKTILKFVELYAIKDVADLYDLPFDEIIKLEGFGQKSVEKLVESINNSRQIQDYKFLAGLGIDGIGPQIAKLILDDVFAV
jgi:DNA ligase (NAD+)